MLSCLLGRAREGGFLSDFKVLGRNGEGLEISYLLFAEDTLVFCEATSSQVTYLSWLLMWFKAISGLKINLDKSELIPIGRVSNVMELTSIFGCKVGVLPTTYFGLPLGAAHNSVVVWDGVEERFRKRLAMWKKQYISKGRRLTLIKSTLASLPIYFVSFLDVEEGSLKVGEDSKGLLVGRWGSREKASFSEMGYCLFKQKKMRPWS